MCNVKTDKKSTFPDSVDANSIIINRKYLPYPGTSVFVMFPISCTGRGEPEVRSSQNRWTSSWIRMKNMRVYPHGAEVLLHTVRILPHIGEVKQNSLSFVIWLRLATVFFLIDLFSYFIMVVFHEYRVNPKFK